MLKITPSTEDSTITITYGNPIGFFMRTMSTPRVERITNAAVRVSRELVIIASQPGRHHHIINTMVGKELVSAEVMAMAEQGFMTTDDRFVDRELGLRIATAAGQLIRKTSPEHQLFSEDLW